MWLFFIMYFGVLVILLYLVIGIGVEWKNFIEVKVLEGKLEDYVVYRLLFFIKGEKYMLFYVQKGDVFDKVGLFKVFKIGVIIIV